MLNKLQSFSTRGVVNNTIKKVNSLLNVIINIQKLALKQEERILLMEKIIFGSGLKYSIDPDYDTYIYDEEKGEYVKAEN